MTNLAEKIKRLEELERKATEGPWDVTKIVVSKRYWGPGDYYDVGRGCVGPLTIEQQVFDKGKQAQNDLDLTAESRNSIKEICAAVREMAASIHELHLTHTHYRQGAYYTRPGGAISDCMCQSCTLHRALSEKGGE